MMCGAGRGQHLANLCLTVLNISIAVLCLSVCCEVAMECVQYFIH